MASAVRLPKLITVEPLSKVAPPLIARLCAPSNLPGTSTLSAVNSNAIGQTSVPVFRPVHVLGLGYYISHYFPLF